MTNAERVHNAALLIGQADKEFKTYREWQKAGFQVQRGEKAMLKVQLWIAKKTKKEEEETKFVFTWAHLFSEDQVKPVEKKAEVA